MTNLEPLNAAGPSDTGLQAAAGSLPVEPRHQVHRAAMSREYTAPRNQMEETLVVIWENVLGLAGIGIHDDFFSLGGDSLLITQIYSRIKQVFSVEISLQQMLVLQTIADLSALIPVEQAGTSLDHRPIKTLSRSDNLPLSFAQQRLWVVDRLEPSSAFNIAMAYRVSGALKLIAVERSLNEIIKRHESLRTTFPTLGGLPSQNIAASLVLTLPLVNLRDLSPLRRETEMRRLASEEARRPFDLGRGPLLRVLLLQLEETEHVLLLTMHHIISDSWSMGVFISEMAALYEVFRKGESPQMPPLAIQYADFASWQREWLQGEVLEEHLSYWKQHLAGAPPLLGLPTDYQRPAAQSYSGARRPLMLSVALTSEVKSLCRQEEVTLFMFLLAAFQILLHYYTRQEDIVVGTDIANRNRIETEGLIGFFVNQLVLRTDLSGNPTFLESLRRVRERVLGAYAHQDLPFEKLLEILKPDRNPTYTPLFQVKLVLQNAPMPVLAVPGLAFHAEEIDTGTAQFDLTLNLFDTEKGLTGELMYRQELFEPSTIAQMLRHFETLLQQIVCEPTESLSVLERYLAEDERRQLGLKEQELTALSLEKLRSVSRKSTRAL